jgi:dTDP-4-dehydrorhamnose reductase
MTAPRTKSLLIGASGQIGRQMLKLLPPGQCLITSRNPHSTGDLPLDLASIATTREAENILGMHSLDAIYCLAGMTNVEGCEDAPDAAHNTNCRGPAILAQIASARAIPFVYFSTEYIFDGTSGPYSEDSPSNPISAYGRSKWDGERAVLAACSHALILRTTVVYGQDSGQKNYLYSVIRSLAAGHAMRVPQDQVSTPTYNRDLAAATLALVDRGASGVFHVCGPERMDRLEFASTVASWLALDTSLLIGLPTIALGQKAPRPLSAGLAIDKLRKSHPDIKMRTLAEGLADCRGNLEEFLGSCAKLASNSQKQ